MISCTDCRHYDPTHKACRLFMTYIQRGDNVDLCQGHTPLSQESPDAIVSADHQHSDILPS